ncbi:hypothetical protein B188_01690 [Candidatus Brocadiaceae bacterium B188]|nr:hypothetical protein B188_01690 [Candidatus Brocadiaceae bacterium B188]
MSIFDAAISLLDKFLKHFFSRLSNKQMDMFVLDLYALFKDYKRILLDAYESPKKNNRQGETPSTPQIIKLLKLPNHGAS